jgi:hypothetical protein
MKIKILMALIFSGYVCTTATAQTVYQEKILSYNLLNYPTAEGTQRQPHFKTVITAENPDILVTTEMVTAAGVSSFLTTVMNTFGQTYAAAPFIDGPDTDGALFFKTNKFNFISQYTLATTLRNINVYNLVHIGSGEALRIYDVHLKASTGFETQRATEIAIIRNETNALPAGKNFIVCGDFNIYTSLEPAYADLLQNNAADDGNVIDPLTGTINAGSWNTNANKAHHTQSTRTAGLTDGGSAGGLDDRFDMILHSTAIQQPGGVTYIAGSYRSVGNDANHYNLEINATPTNTAVSATIANALYYASDHLPVVASYNFVSTAALPLHVVSFLGKCTDDHQNILDWTTTSEEDIQNFYVQTSTNAQNWQPIGKITAKNLAQNTYQYIDKQPIGKTQYYRLHIIENDGTSSYSDVITINNTMATAQIFDATPNPFEQTTLLPYTLPHAQPISLYITDIYGKVVAHIFDGVQTAGQHTAGISTDNMPLAAGVYYAILQTTSGRSVSKMIKQ